MTFTTMKDINKVLSSFNEDRKQELTEFHRSFINPTFNPKMTRQEFIDELERIRQFNEKNGSTISFLINYPTKMEMDFLLEWFSFEYRERNHLTDNQTVFSD